MRSGLQESIKRYKASHPRSEIVNFEGEQKEYPIEQPGLDIIEAQEQTINDLIDLIELKPQSIRKKQAVEKYKYYPPLVYKKL